MKMTTIDVSLHPNQYLIFNDNHRFKILKCGRRWGKSKLGARGLAIKAFNKPGGMYFLVAPYVGQTQIIWRELLSFVPQTSIKRVWAKDKMIELKNGATIWAKSGVDPDGLRGEGLDGCILDEAAMLRPDVWTEAIRPALSDKLGWCWMLSTPKGKNWYYKEYLKGGNQKYPDYASFSFSTYDNPFLKREEIDSMAEELPELVFKQEILAEFIEGGGTVFRDYAGCIREGILRGYEINKFYVMGVDIGLHKDFTVITALEADSREVVYFERFNKTNWTYILDRIESVYRMYAGPICYIDSTGVGDPIYQKLAETISNVVGVNLNQASKPALIRGLALAFDRRAIFIPPIPELLQELEAYTFSMTPLNNIKYGAPFGFHDDTVISLALANYGINGTNPSFIGMPELSGDKPKTPYDSMTSVIDGWEDCVIDIGYETAVIPELEENGRRHNLLKS